MATRNAAPAVVAGLHFQAALLPGGWAGNVRIGIAGAGGSIALIERGVPPEPGDERGFIALPGLPNLHSHAFQRGMAGLTERRGPTADNFWTWRSLMYRFVAQMSPEDLEAITTLAYMEMLEGGFTRVGEFHYLHHDPSGAPYANRAELGARIAAAAQSTGIALTLLPVFYAHGGFGGAPAGEAQCRFLNDVEGYARLLEASRDAVARVPGAVVGVAPHSLRAVAPRELAEVVALAGQGPVHLHVAEQIREVEECVAWSGARPVEWLFGNAHVDERWCLVHATHMTDAETRQLAASGAVAGLCPITEANLGDGLFPAAAFQQAGGTFGIGSDSNVLIRANEELRMLEYAQRLHHRARNVLAGGAGGSTGRALYEAAVNGGARALGVSRMSAGGGGCVQGARPSAARSGTGAASGGGLSVGAPADIVSLSAEAPVFAGRSGDALLDSFIFAGGDGCIDGVWCGGRKVVSDGVHHARAEIRARFRAVLERLLRS